MNLINPIALILAAAQAAPTVVAGIEFLHNEANSATKQQLALDSLTVLTTTAGQLTGASDAAAQLNTLFSSLINLTVAGYNASGVFKHSKPAAASPAATGK